MFKKHDFLVIQVNHWTNQTVSKNNRSFYGYIQQSNVLITITNLFVFQYIRLKQPLAKL